MQCSAVSTLLHRTPAISAARMRALCLAVVWCHFAAHAARHERAPRANPAPQEASRQAHHPEAPHETPASVPAAVGATGHASAPTAGSGCVDVASWKDLDGNSCADYESEGWCDASYFQPGFESKGSNQHPGPAEQCCACGRGRGGCLQAKIDQYCLQAGAGVVARKNGLAWNCYGAVGIAQGDEACVDISGRYTRCSVGLNPSSDAGTHGDRIGTMLREGCLSKAEQERRKREKEEAKHTREAAISRGEISGSCMQDAMDELCESEIPGSFSRRYWSQFVCCSKTRPPTEAEGEEDYACVDQNGYFVLCAPCDTSIPSNYVDRTEQLHAVLRNGCRAPKKLVHSPAAAAAASGRSRTHGAGELARLRAPSCARCSLPAPS